MLFLKYLLYQFLYWYNKKCWRSKTKFPDPDLRQSKTRCPDPFVFINLSNNFAPDFEGFGNHLILPVFQMMIYYEALYAINWMTIDWLNDWLIEWLIDFWLNDWLVN